MRTLLRLSLCIALALPLMAQAHGGMQKIVEGTLLLNLSSVPIAPYAGSMQQNILSVSDVSTDSLQKENFLFDIEIRKDDVPVFRAKNLVATGGLLQFNHVYDRPGTYELAASFRSPSNAHVYSPEDYWVQVIDKPATNGGNGKNVSLAEGIAIGMAIGIAIANMRRRREYMGK